MSDRPTKILVVGNCGADNASISHMLRSHFDVEITNASSKSDAHAKFQEGEFRLVLVNRIFDATGEEGLSLIGELTQQSDVASMLISNFEEAQSQAVKAGAMKGFGKSRINHPETIATIQSAIEKHENVESSS